MREHGKLSIKWWALGVGLSVAFGTPALGQVGDIAGMGYAGWRPSDQVSPVITPSVTYDTASGLWKYRYRVSNDRAAKQDILVFGVNFIATDNRTGLSLEAPPRWWGLFRTTTVPTPLSGVYFMAEVPESATSPNGPTPGQIKPGASLDGFEITSPYPPGLVKTWLRGFAGLPMLSEKSSPDEHAPSVRVPHDTTDAQRGWTIGPKRYTNIAGEAKGVDRLLQFMNLRNGTVHPAPVPIALSLDSSSKRGTLKIILNETDVTSRFYPGPADGASLVGVFDIDEAPLRVGSNRLVTSVDGDIAGSTRTDRDVLEFVVPQDVPALLRKLPETGG